MYTRDRVLGAALALALVVVLASPGTALAQQSEPESSGGVGITVVSLLGVTGISFVGSTQANLREKKLRRKKDELESLVLIDHYLNHNEDEVRFAVALGAGEGLDDLALIMGCFDGLTLEQRKAVRAQRGPIEVALSLDEDPEGGSLRRARALYDILSRIVFPSNEARAEVTR